MKVYVYTFQDGYCSWQSGMSAAERRAEERKHGPLVGRAAA